MKLRLSFVRRPLCVSSRGNVNGTCGPLKSERLAIEPVETGHADETFVHLSDETMWRYFPHQRAESLEQLRETYARRARGPSNEKERWENWVLRERASGAAAGDLQATIFCDEKRALIAYGVFAPFRGRGYAREAVHVLLEHLRSSHNVRRAIAEISPHNEPSLRLIRDLGFVQTGMDGEDLVFELDLV